MDTEGNFVSVGSFFNWRRSH